MVVAVGMTYWYKATASVCPAPIEYRIGDIDASFDLTESQARLYASDAETYWESIADRELFKYDEDSSFTIDFIFDERQATANSEETQRYDLDKKWEESEKIKETVESLQADYQSLSNSYRADVSAYEKRLGEYNSEVNKYNDRGGAPADIFKELEIERKSLGRESEKLNKTAEELNVVAKKINDLSERGNLLVNAYNQEVNEYNEKYGFAREFTQGDYHENNIRIYKFSSESELVTVLAHEFGHSLGIDHVEDESSLMYYLLGDTTEFPVLTEDDILAFNSVCGRNETFTQKVRRVIRDLLKVV